MRVLAVGTPVEFDQLPGRPEDRRVPLPLPVFDVERAIHLVEPPNRSITKSSRSRVAEARERCGPSSDLWLLETPWDRFLIAALSAFAD
jgi:hypothetical protein